MQCWYYSLLFQSALYSSSSVSLVICFIIFINSLNVIDNFWSFGFAFTSFSTILKLCPWLSEILKCFLMCTLRLQTSVHITCEINIKVQPKCCTCKELICFVAYFFMKLLHFVKKENTAFLLSGNIKSATSKFGFNKSTSFYCCFLSHYFWKELFLVV